MAAAESQHGHRATHPRLHIRNAHEAHTLFEAVRLGHLPIVRRRLSPTDRELQSGEVFVWEEASYKGGLERWTDGRKWSQSRMREPFLFYEEKAMPSREEKDAKAARRARKSSDPSSPSIASPALPSSPSPPRRQDRPTKPKGLTKQTYSAFVHAPNAPAGQAPKKWHLTAYFCSTTYHELPVCADDPVLRTITVPENVYVTGKGLTRKNGSQRGVERKDTPSSTPAPPPQAPVQQLPPQGYEEPPMKTPLPPAPATTTLPPPAPISAPQSYPGPAPSSSSPSSVLPNPSYPPPPPHTPFQSHFSATPGSAGSQYSPGHAQPVGYSTSDVRGEAPPSPTGSARSAGSATAGPRYSARHSLDQRALGAFKVTL
ncbi:hypothetical protein FRC00_004479 [Tulasnella sp. 408]|nr:hypothetical protein FRC00_004479 [Tulasnella sp. 408]